MSQSGSVGHTGRSTGSKGSAWSAGQVGYQEEEMSTHRNAGFEEARVLAGLWRQGLKPGASRSQVL